MSAHRLTLRVVPGTFAVCRLPADAPLPAWAAQANPVSITRTADELSIVGDASLVPADVKAARGWSWLALQGPFDFALTGVLASVLDPLAAAGVSIFAVSTYDTDHVLVRTADLPRALAALTAAGHDVV